VSGYQFSILEILRSIPEGSNLHNSLFEISEKGGLFAAQSPLPPGPENGLNDFKLRFVSGVKTIPLTLARLPGGRLPPFTFKESLLVVRGFGAMSAGSIGREEASLIGSSRASAE
jgi:hypothetical protein